MAPIRTPLILESMAASASARARTAAVPSRPAAGHGGQRDLPELPTCVACRLPSSCHGCRASCRCGIIALDADGQRAVCRSLNDPRSFVVLARRDRGTRRSARASPSTPRRRRRPGAASAGRAAAPPRFPGAAAAAGRSGVVERGKQVYGVSCRACHGADLRGGDMGGPNLLRSAVMLNDENGERCSRSSAAAAPTRACPRSI